MILRNSHFFLYLIYWNFPSFITGKSFLSSHNFMEVIPKIEQFQVFNILRVQKWCAPCSWIRARMTIRHQYQVFNNLTYHKKLYVLDENNILRLKFFNDDYGWRQLWLTTIMADNYWARCDKIKNVMLTCVVPCFELHHQILFLLHGEYPWSPR